MLILTRPAAQNAEWAQRLAQRGVATLSLPLIGITPHNDPAALAHRRALAEQPGQFHAIMHVSPNSVTGFWDATTVGHWHAIMAANPAAAPRLWSPGPGTSHALLAQGLPPSHIDQPAIDAGQYDSEALWQVVKTQALPHRRVLVVRGTSAAVDSETPNRPRDGTGRNWLATQLGACGCSVEFLSVYARTLPDWSAEQLALARQASEHGHVWLFSSSEAVRHLAQLLPAQDWSGHRAIATHARIAEAARQIGWHHVALAPPTLDAIVQALQDHHWAV